MADLKSRPLILAKGFLFLVVGTLAAVILLLQAPSLTVAAMLVISIWAYCRFYYFAFYVLEHYVDPRYRFAGLLSFVQYFLRAKRGGSPDVPLDRSGPEA